MEAKDTFTESTPDPQKFNLLEFLSTTAKKYEDMWFANLPPTAPVI